MQVDYDPFVKKFIVRTMDSMKIKIKKGLTVANEGYFVFGGVNGIETIPIPNFNEMYATNELRRQLHLFVQEVYNTLKPRVQAHYGANMKLVCIAVFNDSVVEEVEPFPDHIDVNDRKAVMKWVKEIRAKQISKFSEKLCSFAHFPDCLLGIDYPYVRLSEKVIMFKAPSEWSTDYITDRIKILFPKEL